MGYQPDHVLHPLGADRPAGPPYLAPVEGDYGMDLPVPTGPESVDSDLHTYLPFGIYRTSSMTLLGRPV